MKGFRKIWSLMLLMFMLVGSGTGFCAETNDWKPIKDIETSAKVVSQHPDIDIFASSSRIFVNVNQPVKIEIFTILGKLVSSKTLNPGAYEYKLNTHGIYIVKSSEMTCKVAV